MASVKGTGEGTAMVQGEGEVHGVHDGDGQTQADDYGMETCKASAKERGKRTKSATMIGNRDRQAHELKQCAFPSLLPTSLPSPRLPCPSSRRIATVFQALFTQAMGVPVP